MFNIVETEKSDVFFVGDIHGEFKSIGNWVKMNNLHDCSIIFCGDFGLGFTSVQKETQDLLKSNNICKNNNVSCYAIRGNHDDPSYYNTDTPKINLSNIETVSDYTVIKTPEHNILCVGGAISVDRADRMAMYQHEISELIEKKHYSIDKAKKKARLYWWDNEEFIFNDTALDEIKKYNIKIDVVATHSAPDFCQPKTNPKAIGWTMVDRDLEEDLYIDRKKITKLYTHLKDSGNEITNWFYGHYHTHNFEVINGTKFVGLDMGRKTKHGGGVGGCFDMIELR